MEKLWTDVDDYISDRFSLDERALVAALESMQAANMPAISVSPPQGRFLRILAHLVRAERILEIGTLGGYSTICLAQALPPQGRLVTLESVARHAEVARANIRAAGLAERVDVRVGRALDTLPELAGLAPFDLVFIDADKSNNANYFDWALKLARPGALIVIDNTVRKGALLESESDDPVIVGIRSLHERVRAEPRVLATTLQTVGCKGYDGLTLAWVKSAP